MTTEPTAAARRTGTGTDVTAGRDGARQASVLVARAEDRAGGLVERLRAAGVRVTTAPVIERAPVEDAASLGAARERLARGGYEWVVITSVNAVDALLGEPTATQADAGQAAAATADPAQADPAGTADPAGPVTRPGWIPEATRWAAVGPATERALARHGIPANLVPETRTAAALADAFPPAPPPTAPPSAVGMAVAAIGAEIPATAIPTATRAVLLPLGDLAGDHLPRALAAKGWEPHVVTAYRTVARKLPADVVGAMYDLVVVSSGSAARQVAAQLGQGRAVVAIGEPSADAARRAGLDVVATATQPTDAALADAVLAALASTALTSTARVASAPSPPTTAPTTKEYP